MSIPERFWTWWFDGFPQPVADRMFKRVVDDEVHKLAERLADENRTLREQVEELTRQRDAAQDEIEKLISEKEALRAERDDIQHRFDLTWAYAAPRVTVMTMVQNPASAPGGGS